MKSYGIFFQGLAITVMAFFSAQSSFAYKDLVAKEISAAAERECAIAFGNKPIGPAFDREGNVCRDGDHGCFLQTEKAIVVGILASEGDFVTSDAFHGGPPVRKYFDLTQYEEAKAYLSTLVKQGLCK